jgi:hypothetical protein
VAERIGCGPGRQPQVLGVQDFGMGIRRQVALDDPYSGAALEAGRHVVKLSILETDHQDGVTLAQDVRVHTAGSQCQLRYLPRQIRLY